MRETRAPPPPPFVSVVPGVRGLAELLLHAGRASEAAAELAAYMDCLRPGRGSTATVADPFDVRLTQQLWQLVGAGMSVKPERCAPPSDCCARNVPHGPQVAVFYHSHTHECVGCLPQ